MHIAVAIVGYRNADDVAACLAALGRGTHAEFEVVVCENGGPDAHAELLRRSPDPLPGGQAVRVLLAPGNLGYAGGVNTCLRESPDADGWWVLNPDAVPAPDALAALVRRLARGDCELVAGVVHYQDGRVGSFGGRWRPWLGRAVSVGHGRRLEDPVDARAVERRLTYVPGGSMLVGRRFLAAVGPMREDYFLYGEEVEWCERGRALGMRIGFAPDARVLHHQGTTTGSAADWRQRPRLPIHLDERNKLLITRDRHPWRFPVAAAAGLALAVLRYGRRRAWRQLGYALDGWWDGVRGRRGVPDWVG